ncbi:D-alanine--D-alanine ligase [Sulfurimonas sp. MAG313]|nr:D-alanine--D-alanine ligase [Sulfurimonas sp. MAG313]MDF1880283.1 D-alanine--D-alanine ligase [Sulfurimonas sp. MAG313]
MNLAILFGGASYEHEISIVSAITLKDKLSSLNLEFIFLDQDHTFYSIHMDKMDAKTFSTGAYKKFPVLSLEQGGFSQKGFIASKSIRFDRVLNLIHGADGEDATMASLFEFYNIEYIGPRKDASVMSFDKFMTKAYAYSCSVDTVEYELLSGQRKSKIAFPFIIKPTRLGSSIGVSIVKSAEGLDYALDVAYEFDERLLIEPFIKDVKEYNVAGTMTKDGLIMSIIEEPQKEEFLDFDKKYLDFSRSDKVNEADISESLKKELYAAFEKIYIPIFEGALIRCDFFVVDGKVLLNEINPIPGSMGNYLFEDFTSLIKYIKLPIKKEIKVNYNYLHSIRSAKGKA